MTTYAVSTMPVLPPLRLNERAPSHIQLPSIHELCPDYDHKMSQSLCRRPHAPPPYARPALRPRQDSVSSSMTSRSSATPSPPPTAQSIRIVLISNWDDADFALVVPPPTNPQNPGAPQNSRPRLLYGAEFAQFRASGYRGPPGARVYPYRSQRILNSSNAQRPHPAGKSV